MEEVIHQKMVVADPKELNPVIERIMEIEVVGVIVQKPLKVVEMVRVIGDTEDQDELFSVVRKYPTTLFFIIMVLAVVAYYLDI